LIELDGFGGYGHYESTVKAMESNVQNGYMIKVSENSYEIIYRCDGYGSDWSIGKPDFPVTQALVKWKYHGT
jgi:hypothetical protein